MVDALVVVCGETIGVGFGGVIDVGRFANGKEIAMEVTINQLANAFTEWDRRYREDPEGFQNEAESLLRGTAETYGEEAAPYFVKILDDLSSDALAKIDFRNGRLPGWREGYTVGYDDGARLRPR